MKNQKEKLWNQSHSPLQQKKIKSLGINLPKETKELYTEYYNTLMKEFKDDINIPSLERYSMFLGRKNQYCENDYTTNLSLQIQCNPYQITNDIFHREKKEFHNSYENTKDPKQPK